MELPTLDRFPQPVLAKIDIQRAFIISRLIVAAERLQLFRLLHGRHLKAEAIGRKLNIHKSFLKTFLNSLVSLRLLGKAKDTYWNTPLAEKYFVAQRSIYWTRQYSKECVQDYEALTRLEKVLASGRSYASIQRVKKPRYTEIMERDRRQAEDFTQMLFHLHRDDAEALANYLDLSSRRAVLDVGGGSGVMSIALAKQNPHLRATILDVAPVCGVAARNIRRGVIQASQHVGRRHAPQPAQGLRCDHVLRCRTDNGATLEECVQKPPGKWSDRSRGPLSVQGRHRPAGSTG